MAHQLWTQASDHDHTRQYLHVAVEHQPRNEQWTMEPQQAVETWRWEPQQTMEAWRREQSHASQPTGDDTLTSIGGMRRERIYIRNKRKALTQRRLRRRKKGELESMAARCEELQQSVRLLKAAQPFLTGAVAACMMEHFAICLTPERANELWRWLRASERGVNLQRLAAEGTAAYAYIRARTDEFECDPRDDELCESMGSPSRGLPRKVSSSARR